MDVVQDYLSVATGSLEWEVQVAAQMKFLVAIEALDLRGYVFAKIPKVFGVAHIVRVHTLSSSGVPISGKANDASYGVKGWAGIGKPAD